MIIDLRSDTVTKPTPAMREAMFNAPVGDDVFEEDPTINALEEKSAKLFGKEAALFCTSGTMANQIAINILTHPMEEVICDKTSHIYYYEVGGYAFNSGLSIRMINGNRGRITAQDVLDNINPDNVHAPATTLVSLENSANKGGGSCYKLDAIKEISKVCRTNNLRLHLDGARIFNALEATKVSPAQIGENFDTINFCLSKGLGAPVGSMLLSSKENIKKARRVRKVFGGGMRQGGFLAAAGIFALDNNVKRLADDHKRAEQLGDTIKSLNYVEELLPVETNIVVFRISKDVQQFLNYLASNNIKAFQFGPGTIRFVTHLDFTDDMLQHTIETLREF